VVDQGFVCQESHDDLPALCAKIVEELAKGKQTR